MLISARPQDLTSGTSPWLSRFPRHCSSRFKTMRLISAAQTKWFIWDMTAPLNKVLVVSLGHHYNCAGGTASQMCPQGRTAPVAEFLSQDPVQSVTKSTHTSGMIQKSFHSLYEHLMSLMIKYWAKYLHICYHKDDTFCYGIHFFLLIEV